MIKLFDVVNLVFVTDAIYSNVERSVASKVAMKPKACSKNLVQLADLNIMLLRINADVFFKS